MLDLSRNALTGALSNTVPDTLEILDASENRLSSGLGDWLGKGRLVEVILAENDFEGELPSAVCNAHTVRVDLSGNALRGALPESIEECVKLETLKIGGVGGGFGGGGGASLPSAGAFEKLARLTELSLPGFGLVGAIPTSVFAISKLRVLNLADNQLSGTIPAVSSTSLVEIRLDGNALEGDVPLSLLTLPELTALFLSENRLTGMEAPAANDTTFATEVTEIHLGGNRLTSIPEVLRNVTELESLNLSRNDIAGPVPTWLGLFSRLRELDLSENRLSGSLAGWLGDHHALRDLEDLRVGGNVGIEGPLSAASIRSLARLKTLNLTGVGRFGAFPIAAGTPDLGLVSLVNLIAANAGFTGRLPPRMFDALPNLVHLDLRGNALEGSVPADVAPAEESLVENFSSERSSPEARVLTHAALRCLLLSENAFSGVFPRLDAPAYYLATSFSSTGSDASTLLGVVDFSDAGRFDCPLPDRSVVYDTASCACAAGRAGPDDGRYECDDCPPGSFSNLESSEACAPCAAGEVSAAPGASSCDACPPGTFATAGSATCAKCAAGTFASTSRAGACDACPPGEHQPVEGETSCVKCAAGSSASTPGSATCAFCPAGALPPPRDRRRANRVPRGRGRTRRDRRRVRTVPRERRTPPKARTTSRRARRVRPGRPPAEIERRRRANRARRERTRDRHRARNGARRRRKDTASRTSAPSRRRGARRARTRRTRAPRSVYRAPRISIEKILPFSRRTRRPRRPRRRRRRRLMRRRLKRHLKKRRRRPQKRRRRPPPTRIPPRFSTTTDLRARRVPPGRARTPVGRGASVFRATRPRPFPAGVFDATRARRARSSISSRRRARCAPRERSPPRTRASRARPSRPDLSDPSTSNRNRTEAPRRRDFATRGPSHAASSFVSPSCRCARRVPRGPYRPRRAR